MGLLDGLLGEQGSDQRLKLKMGLMGLTHRPNQQLMAQWGGELQQSQATKAEAAKVNKTAQYLRSLGTAQAMQAAAALEAGSLDASSAYAEATKPAPGPWANAIEVNNRLVQPGPDGQAQVLFDGNTPEPGFRLASQQEEQAYGGPGQIGPDGKFYPLENAASEPLVRNVKLADGSEVMVQWNQQTQKWDPAPIPEGGSGGQPRDKLTESQSKITLFQTLQTETAPVLDQIEKIWDPANIPDAAARSTPIAGNFFQSQQGQIYYSAASAWAEGALRISTGAAATEPEIQRTLKTYFAQPGDTPQTVQFKNQMRAMYERSIQRALGARTVEGQLALPADFASNVVSGAASPPAASGPVVIDGYTVEAIE